MRVQQRVGQRPLLPEVRRVAQQARQRMPRRQLLERGDEIAYLVVRGRDADQPAELLQHVDAGPSVRRVHHEVHRAVRLEHVAQRAQRRVGIRRDGAGRPCTRSDRSSFASSPTRSIGSCCTSRLVRLCLRLSSSVQRTLVALKSMPVTWRSASAARAWPPATFRSRRRGSCGSPLYEACGPEQMKVRAAPARGPANALDSRRDCRSAADTDTARRNPEPQPQRPAVELRLPAIARVRPRAADLARRCRIDASVAACQTPLVLAAVSFSST